MRTATPADAPEVHRLLTILGRPAADPASPGQEAALARHMADPACLVLVGEADGSVVGMAAVWFRDRLGWETPEAWIPDLCVDPAARRAGVATALVERAREEARARGCHLIRLETGRAREEAHALHPRLGFADTGVSYTRRP